MHRKCVVDCPAHGTRSTVASYYYGQKFFDPSSNVREDRPKWLRKQSAYLPTPLKSFWIVQRMAFRHVCGAWTRAQGHRDLSFLFSPFSGIFSYVLPWHKRFLENWEQSPSRKENWFSQNFSLKSKWASAFEASSNPHPESHRLGPDDVPWP